MKEVIALSFGGGYGSTGLGLMLQDGLLEGTPKPDLAVFADTQAEPPHVYDLVEWFKTKVDYPVLVVSAGDLWADTWKLINGQGMWRHPNGDRMPDIPVFSDGGPTKRQCTGDYKIAVVKRAVRQFAEVNPPELYVTQYLGISLDEASRQKDSGTNYITHRYPLIENRINRAAIMAYMNERHPEAPIGRSACFFCPFHSIAEWRDIRAKYPGLYQEAVDMERAMCQMPDGPFYLYKGKYGTSLETAMANADMQGMLWPESDQFQNECEGHCNT